MLSPQEWLNGLGDALGDWLSELGSTILNGITVVIIDGLAISMFCYGIYCAGRIMCTTKDEKFDEYTNKVMITMVIYFCAKCATKLIGLG